MRQMMRALRSYLVALKASSRLGRAYRLRNKGQKREALAIANDGLKILSSPVVKRQNPAEGSALACLTILVEELSSELQQPGASMYDLMDTLKLIKNLPAESSGDIQKIKTWVPYLEAKTGNAPSV